MCTVDYIVQFMLRQLLPVVSQLHRHQVYNSFLLCILAFTYNTWVELGGAAYILLVGGALMESGTDTCRKCLPQGCTGILFLGGITVLIFVIRFIY